MRGDDASRGSGERAGPGAAGAFEPPAITLPKGGGAIRGIGEKFGASPVTGTGSTSVPISLSSSRSGFGPALSLRYDSGRGNGPFGFGWGLSLPAVTRRTDKGLPRYDDAGESDVFLLSDAEDLVPVLAGDQGWARESWQDPPHAPGYRIDRFRPRVEGLFARIERWTRSSDGDVHWRSVTRDNVTTVYGLDDSSRIADPHDSSRVFSWLICGNHDDRGNAVRYEYAAEDGAGVDLAAAHERHRAGTDRSAGRHLKRVLYGNRVSRLLDPQLSDPDWMFEAVLDYGEHDADAPTPWDAGVWARREDPFSSYRGGFEVRTYRLCRRVLMFHHFPGEEGVGAGCLVRSTDFGYATGAAAGAFLASVTKRGYRRVGGGYVARAMPPVEFAYSPAELRDDVAEVDAASLSNLPAGLATQGCRWADLDGEGVAGMLLDQGGTWYYKPNLGGAQFGPLQPLPSVPSLAGQAGAGTRLLDLAGDGQLDVVSFGGPTPGFFERTEQGGWDSFRDFAALPRIDWDQPSMRLVDLDGDGHADVLLTEDEAFVWHSSRAEAGFGAARRVVVPRRDKDGPRLVFADGTGSVHLADMSGDGLSDLVRIRNGEVCYWPNLGHGRFGPKVTMDGAPWFDRDELFDQRYLQLADIDGSGVTDLVYCAADEVRIFLNRSGNGWNDAHHLAAVPDVDDRAEVAAVDLFGTGTACLVWSSDRPDEARRSLRYLDLLGGRKPHLLVRIDNNLGSRTDVQYASSTSHYLADKAAGTPWLTRLPFPVQVVQRVETVDRVGGNRFVTRYAYHHGYFDGADREFRGFGMVEQWDTEEFAAIAEPGSDPVSHVPPVWTKTWYHTGAFAGTAAGLSQQYAAGYWQEPGLTPEQQAATLLDDTVWPDGIRLPDGSVAPYAPTAQELREACRALKGAILRQEVYGLDGSAAAGRPYSVTERGYAVELLQPLADLHHAVCHVRPRETLRRHYERKLYDIDLGGGNTVARADPRVTHELALDTDAWGNVLRSATVAYGRRFPDADLDPLLSAGVRDVIRAAQTSTHVTLTVDGYTNPVLDGDTHRAPMPCESRTYELLKVAPAGGLFRLAELRGMADEAGDGAHDLPYEDTSAAGAVADHPYRRLCEHTRVRYRRDDLAGALPPGQAQSLGLPSESYRLAFTSGLLDGVYRRSLDGGPEQHLLPQLAVVLGLEGGHVYADGGWWIPSGQVFYSLDDADSPAQELANARAHFFLPARYADPFGGRTTVHFDQYDLLVLDTRDPVGSRLTAGQRAAAATPDDEAVTSGLDYRVLAPRVVSDANRNRSAVLFDGLGLVVATAVMGKPEEQLGDALAGLEPDLSEAAVAAHLADPLAGPHALLGGATSRLVYDFFAFHRTRDDPQPQPVAVSSLARETHHTALGPGQQTRIEHRVSYSDGFGRIIQSKALAEPGPVADAAQADPRWVGTGWTVFDNKGNPVRRYEPFFAATHGYERAKTAGVSPVVCYDPVGRLVATLLPDDSYTKMVFDPWQHATWDGNDTVLLDPGTDDDVRGYLEAHLAGQPPGWQTWHQRRVGGALGPREQAVAAQTELHAATPGVGYSDPLGRMVVTVAHNRFAQAGTGTVIDERHPAVVLFDVEGAQLEVVDACGVTVLRTVYDVAGRALHTRSPDAGWQWMVPDAAGAVIRRWDSRGHAARHDYDPGRRPTQVWVRAPGAAGERLVALTVYGEADPHADAANLRGRTQFAFDGAGLSEALRHDFKGNLLAARRQLAREYRDAPDWGPLDGLDTAAMVTAWGPLLEPEVFGTAADFDALNRPTLQVLPDTTVLLPRYNEAGLLEAVSARLPGTVSETPFITGCAYDAKGQRERIDYANGVHTVQVYDPQTFRLLGSTTRRGGEALQDLSYVYDPAGNPASIADAAQQTVFFAGQVVAPGSQYVYDAVYRLVSATGREHVSLGVQPDHAGTARQQMPHPNDGQALRGYTQRYTYDAVGNILAMAHVAGPGSWTRQYDYAADSNRLLAHSTPGGSGSVAFEHDAHGNMTSMPHLAGIAWDSDDQISAVDLGPGGGTAYYTYDGSGQRVRKVVEHLGGLVEERIYLAGYEVYRRRVNLNLTFERQTVHVSDDQQRMALVEGTTVAAAAPLSTGQRRIRYQLDNHLRSACLEVDENAAVISYEEYHPYGTTSLWLATDAAEVSAKRYRYTGKERDEETGLCYHGARYYAPWLARWTSYDPVGVRDGESRYAYVRGNPVRFFDPDGQDCGQKQPAVPVLASMFPGSVGWAVRPQLNPCLDQHPGWQQWHADAEKRASLAAATFNRNTAAVASGTVTLAYTLAYAGVTAGPVAVAAGQRVTLWALTKPKQALLAKTLLEFGIGLVDPHPPGYSPIDIPGSPADNAGRLARQTIVRNVKDVMGVDDLVKISVRHMKPKQLADAVEQTWKMDKHGMQRQRGEILEGALAATRYKFFEWVGRLQGGFFKGLDFYANRIGVQLKTLHALPKVNEYKGFIDNLLEMRKSGLTPDKRPLTSVALDIAIPKGFKGPEGKETEFAAAIKEIVDYGRRLGIPVNVYEVTEKQMNLVQVAK